MANEEATAAALMYIHIFIISGMANLDEVSPELSLTIDNCRDMYI